MPRMFVVILLAFLSFSAVVSGAPLKHVDRDGLRLAGGPLIDPDGLRLP